MNDFSSLWLVRIGMAVLAKMVIGCNFRQLCVRPWGLKWPWDSTMALNCYLQLIQSNGLISLRWKLLTR